MTYKEAMCYIESTYQYGSVLGLDNIKELLNRLGNPQNQIRCIHIAGTNGKGSVASYITTILMKSGYKTGRYISPVLFDYCERIQTDNQYISEEAVAEHMTVMKEVIEGMLEDGMAHPTPFEIETAMAFLEFVRQSCDIVLLEVGMGGRYDATNIIEQAECAVFTPISMDHMAVLGDSLTRIAYEKAGIIKAQCNIVTAKQPEEVLQVLQKEKEAVHNPNAIQMVKQENISDISYALDGTAFVYMAGKETIKLQTAMLGIHQVENAALAIEVIFALKKRGYDISRQHIQEGITETRWKGRFDILKQHPYVIVDGAHNEAGALALKKSLDKYFPHQKLIAIAGIFADKEYEKILQITLERVKSLYTITPDNPRGLKSEKLQSCAEKYCDRVSNADTVENAIKMAMQEATEEDVIVIYGSLSYLHQVYEMLEHDIAMR